MGLDKLKNKIWDVFGFLVAVLFLLGAVAVFAGIGYGIYQFKTHYVDGVSVDDNEDDGGKGGLQLTVQYQTPLPVEGGDYWIVPVNLEKKKQGEAEDDQRKSRGLSESSLERYDSGMGSDFYSYAYGWGPCYNLVFIHKTTGESRLLLDYKGYIAQIFILEARREKQDAERNPEFILLKMAVTDTNRDGKINGKDALPGYLVSLDGTKLTQITPDLTQMGWWRYDSAAKTVFVEAVQDLNGDKKYNWDDPKVLLSVNVNEPKMGQEIVPQGIKDKVEAIL